MTPSSSAGGRSIQVAVWLTLAPLLWAGNAVVGRLMVGQVPPVTFNAMRWWLAALLLLPWAYWVLKPSSPLWKHGRRMAWLGFLGMGCYNTLQYMALQTSSPLNVTLVASSMPMFMLGLGRLFFGARITGFQALGVLFSCTGVLWVLSRGSMEQLLQLQWAKGDLLMLLATATWSWYSWLLMKPPKGQTDPPELRQHWAAWLMAQLVPGVLWSSLMAGAEWGVQPHLHIDWSWGMVAGWVYVSVGASLMAYYFWGKGVSAAGPQTAGFFANLTPLFAAVLSAAVLHEWPQSYHLVGFALIVGGIWVSSRRSS